MRSPGDSLRGLLSGSLIVYPDFLNQVPREVFFDQELGLFGLSLTGPVARVHGIPVDVAKVGQIGAILEIV